jgi:hypothetical protein
MTEEDEKRLNENMKYLKSKYFVQENQRLTEIIQKLKTDACVCSETEKCIYCIEIEAALEGSDNDTE